MFDSLIRSVTLTVLFLLSVASTAVADTRVEGAVFAPSPCEFISPTEGEIACAAVIVPLRAVFELKSENGRGSVTRRVRTDGSGNYSAMLSQGRYRLTLVTVERALPTGGFVVVPLSTIATPLRYVQVPRRQRVRINLPILRAPFASKK